MSKIVNTHGYPRLYNALYDYQMDVILDVLNYRIANGITPSIKADHMDYPAVITAVESGNDYSTGRSESGRCGGQRCSQLHPLIVRELKRLMPSWTHPCTDGSYNSMVFLGTCAEDDAVTKLFDKLSISGIPLPPLNHLTFASPLRPRTSDLIPCCDVCKELFGQ